MTAEKKSSTSASYLGELIAIYHMNEYETGCVVERCEMKPGRGGLME